MDGKYIAAAVPVFFLLILIEVLVNRRRPVDRGPGGRASGYGFQDSITNLSCGVGQQVIGVLLRTVPVFLYTLLYEHLRVYTVSPSSVLGWVLMLFLVDLCYWTYHFASHRVNFLWATHIVHHQSEEYNLSVALRQSWFAQTMTFVFYLPLAVLGFPPVMYLTMVTLNTLYQFWIHTRAVSRLGPLEWVFNTPSHHRVHHGINPEYIDKNHAGIFIIWDRLFGTFCPERDEPVYGTVAPLESWNPLYANVMYWGKLAEMSRQTRRLRDKVLLWLKPPEWRPEDLGGVVTIPAVSRAGQRRYDPPAPFAMKLYVGVHFALVVLASTGLLLVPPEAGQAPVLALAGAVLAGLVSFGGLLEGRPFALPLELARLALSVLAAALFVAAPLPLLATIGTGLVAAVAALALLSAGLLVTVVRRKSALDSPAP